MTQDEIIRMAREAGFTDIEATALEYFYQAAFEAGAAYEREKLMNVAIFSKWYQELDAAVLAEREACAKVCEPVEGSAYEVGVYKTMQTLAAAIRARGEK